MKFKLRKTYVLIITLVATFACIVLFKGIDDWYVSDKLGNNYVLSSDNGILYCTNGHNYFVIPFGITAINHDSKWIIAKTINLSATYKKSKNQCNDGSQYWIINKSASIIKIDSIHSSNIMLINDYDYPIISNGLIGPLDSISFSNKLKKLGIRLSFSENVK